MQEQNVQIVEKLSNGKFIVKIENQVQETNTNEVSTIVKYTLADKNGIVNMVDLNSNSLGFQFFDIYELNENGEIIIGIKKTEKEYYERIISNFDLSDTLIKVIEEPGGDVGPYEKPHYRFINPTKNIDDIIPRSYKYNFGFINKEGILVISPSYDYIEFGNEDTCIVGKLSYIDLSFGYIDTNSGKFITPICFKKAHKFYDNRAMIKLSYKYGYIDRNKVITNPGKNEEYADGLYPRFDWASSFNNGIATAGLIRGTHLTPACHAKIDKTGIIAIVPQKRLHLVKKD